MSKYNDIIEATIGRVLLETSVDNSFPLIGEEVQVNAWTKYSQNVEFTTKNSVEQETITNKPNTSQHEVMQVLVQGIGDLKQTMVASNFLYEKTMEHYIFALQNQTLPYFDFEISSEINRTNENFSISVKSEMGYSLNTSSNVLIEIFNEEDTLIQTLNPLLVGDMYMSSNINISQRGYYNVIVSVTKDGVTHKRRKNKIITITPRLAERPTQYQIDNNQYTTLVASAMYDVKLKMYETGVNDLYCVFELRSGQTDNDSGWYPDLNLSLIPAGKSAYTIVLKGNTNPVNYSRILLTGSTNIYASNANGTPQFSYDNPLVFTIDQETPLEIFGVGYNTVNYNSCIRNTVWDGRGYYNLSLGIKFKRYSTNLFWEDAFMLLNGTSDIEIFECEIERTGFTAIMAKTDPKNNTPWFWKNNFEFKNFVWHHSYVHDTGGEGCYLGYFTSEQENAVYTGATTTFQNLLGLDVTYINGQTYPKRAHEMKNLRVFRNTWKNTGYDGVQVSNATESEFCYNVVENAAIKNEKDQASGASLQSMDGLIYNNVVKSHNGPAYQIGPYRDGIEFFNNICQSFNRTDAIQFLFSLTSPDHNPTGGASGVKNDTTMFNFHNNVFISGRYTANGRNTVQMQKMYFTDNVMVNMGVNFSNMTTETLALWESQKKNNLIYTIQDFINNLGSLKIADAYHFDFRIAKDSPLINLGCGDFFTMDARGYLNWNTDMHPVGPYLGIHKADYVVPIIGITIESKPENITGSFQCNAILNPTNTTETGIIWSSNNENVATVDETGLVTVVAQGTATITVTSAADNLISDSFQSQFYTQALSTARISFGNYDVNGNPIGGNKFEGGTNIITYLAAGASRNLYNTAGNAFGSFLSVNVLDELNAGSNVDSTPGAIVASEGFTALQLKAWTWYPGSLGYETQTITGIPSGRYRIKIFASNNYALRPANTGAYYRLVVDEGNYDLTGVNVHNNLSSWFTQELNIGASGLSIVFGNNGGTNGYSKIPINNIVIEQIS